MFGSINPFSTNYYSAPALCSRPFSMPFFGMNNFSFNIPSIYNSCGFNSRIGYTNILSDNDNKSSIMTSLTNTNSSGFLTEPVFTQIIDSKALNSDTHTIVQNTNKPETDRPLNNKTRIISNKEALKEPGFLEAVKGVAQRVNCDYRDLLAVMNAECGLNPHAQNKKSKAIGLIQFMPNTAIKLGTSIAALAKMSATEQLVYVEKFLKRNKEAYGFAGNARLRGVDLYCLVFLPARAHRDVLCVAGEKNKNGKRLRYYEANKGVDLNKDGKITKAEMATRVENFRLKEVAVA